MTMDNISKLSTLLDNLEARELIFALAHVGSAAPGASRLRAAILRLAETTNLGQYRSWLSDDTPNKAMTGCTDGDVWADEEHGGAARHEPGHGRTG